MNELIGDTANTETQTITGRTEWQIAGGYYKLIASSAAVALELWRNGRRVLYAPQATTGFYQFIAFDKIVITPGGSTTITFLAAPGEGGNDSIASNAQITGPLDGDNVDAGAALGANGLVAVAARLKGYNGATFDRLRSVTIGDTGILGVNERGFAYGASFASIAALAANATEQVFAAASNVNGAWVWDAEIDTSPASPGGLSISLHAHTVAPTAFTSGDVMLQTTINVATAAGITSATSRPLRGPRFIAAGKGLWFLCLVNGTTGEANIARRKVLYTFR